MAGLLPRSLTNDWKSSGMFPRLMYLKRRPNLTRELKIKKKLITNYRFLPLYQSWRDVCFRRVRNKKGVVDVLLSRVGGFRRYSDEGLNCYPAVPVYLSEAHAHPLALFPPMFFRAFKTPYSILWVVPAAMQTWNGTGAPHTAHSSRGTCLPPTR